jgi:hypothetical protein
MGVHVNNAGEFPVFSLGAKESAYDPPPRVAGASTAPGSCRDGEAVDMAH